MASSVRRSITALIIAPMMVARALLSTQMLIGGRRRLASTMGAGARSTPPAEDVKRLVLVRHGEVDLAMFDGKKCLYGGVDIPLSSKGRDEAAAAAAVLEGEEDISVLWASPLSRAVYGAERIAERQDGMGRSAAAVVRHDGFREVDRGEWVGQTLEEIGSEEMARWNRDPTFRPGGGAEALADVAARVLAAKDELLARSPWGSTTCLVSHMWVTRSIVGEAIGFDTVKDTARLQVGREVGRQVGRKVGRKVGRFTRGGEKERVVSASELSRPDVFTYVHSSLFFSHGGVRYSFTH
jgi:broad specificity phosphatase PhoE